jgi:hypothetical protein
MRPLAIALALAAASCASTTGQSGVVVQDATTPMVAIGAGHVRFGNSSWLETRYIIDRSTQTCWFLAGYAPAPLDCCALARVPAAQPYLTWTTACATPPVAAPPVEAPPSAEAPSPPAL